MLPILLTASFTTAFCTIAGVVELTEAVQKQWLKRQIAWVFWITFMLLLTIWASIAASHFIPN